MDDQLSRSLPNASEAERGVLGAILLSPQLIARARRLIERDDWFYTPSHRIAWLAMCAIADARVEVDAIGLSEELKRRLQLESVGGYPFLKDLTYGLPHSMNIEPWCNLMRSKWLTRQAMKEYDSAVSALREEEDLPEIIIASTTENTRALINQNRALIHKGGTLEEITPRILAYLEQLESGENPAIATGLEDLDRLIRGGPCPGDLVGICAKTGHGKSIMLKQMGHQASVRGQGAILFPLEMSAEQNYLRMLAPLANVSMNDIVHGMDPAKLERLRRVIPSLARLPFRIYTDCLTVPAMAARVEEVMQTQAVHLVMVDYFQLVQPSKKSDSRTVDLEDIANSLKRMAMDLNVPVIVPAQFDKEGSKSDRPKLEDVKFGGAFAQACDVVWVIVTEDFNPEMSERYRPAKLYVDKQRNGPPGVVNLVLDGPATEFLPGVKEERNTRSADRSEVRNWL